jgi:hypothetical protein
VGWAALTGDLLLGRAVAVVDGIASAVPL